MNIDDILAEVGGDETPGKAWDLQELTRCWVTERSAPEILPWPSALMDRVLERVRLQIEVVEDQVGNTDPKTNLRLVIIQTELERFKFLVRSLLRARISKLDKHALYVLTDATQTARLSPSEVQYVNSHQSLLQAHYHSCFLSQLPPSLQRLDDTAGGMSMVDQPDFDRAVFVRALRDVGELVHIQGTDTVFEMKRGDIYVVRWSAVKELVFTGDAELL
ncbi:MAG: hypothetical protein LQ342_001583 [Letrouitia transgressa]|nr:MAG: hypothetical protein LQ342_001583 [Letrouitia transgressa]